MIYFINTSEASEEIAFSFIERSEIKLLKESLIPISAFEEIQNKLGSFMRFHRRHLEIAVPQFEEI